MVPIPDEAQLGAGARFMAALTKDGVLLVLLLLAGGVVLYAMYELRGQWAPLLWTSPWVGVWGAFSLLALAGWSAISSMAKRVDATMTAHISRLEASVAECHHERAELRARVRDVEMEERLQSVRVAQLQDEIAHLKLRARRGDRDADSGHGPLDG